MTRGLKYPPFAKPAPQQESRAAESVSREETLPSIDDFLDELPAIDDFLLGEEEYVADQQVESYPAETEAEASTEEGWAAGAWQSYDWSSVASLNRSTSSAMDSSDACIAATYGIPPNRYGFHCANPPVDLSIAAPNSRNAYPATNWSLFGPARNFPASAG